MPWELKPGIRSRALMSGYERRAKTHGTGRDGRWEARGEGDTPWTWLLKSLSLAKAQPEGWRSEDYPRACSPLRAPQLCIFSSVIRACGSISTILILSEPSFRLSNRWPFLRSRFVQSLIILGHICVVFFGDTTFRFRESEPGEAKMFVSRRDRSSVLNQSL